MPEVTPALAASKPSIKPALKPNAAPGVSPQRDILVKSKREEHLVRLLLIGPPGSGKTYNACTFPNPIIIDWDNNQPPEVAEREFPTLPVWNEQFRYDNPIGNLQPNLCKNYPYKWFLKWLMSDECRRLTPSETLVFDSMSMINDAIMAQIDELESKEIEKNSYHRWGSFADKWVVLATYIKNLPCNVVMIAHENELRDNETNRLLQRIWLMDGKKFTPRLPSFFNNVFRQVRSADKPGGMVSASKIDDVDPSVIVKEEYWWQIRDDNGLFPFARTTIKSNKKFVPAHYDSFKL